MEGKSGIDMQGRVEPVGAATLNIKTPWHPLGIKGVATSEEHATEKRARSLGLPPYLSETGKEDILLLAPSPKCEPNRYDHRNNRARAIGIDNGEGHPIREEGVTFLEMANATHF